MGLFDKFKNIFTKDKTEQKEIEVYDKGLEKTRKELFSKLDELNKKYNTTIVMVIHELNNAARFAHHIIGVKKGKICCKGTAEEVMTKENLRELFNIDSEIVTDPRTKKPVCITYDMVR